MLNHFCIDSVGFTNHFSWNAHNQRVGRDDFALRNECTGGDDGTSADDRTVQYDGTYAYQAVVFDRRAMDDRSMPNSHTVADGTRESRIAVQAAEILNVGLGTDPDPDAITSNHGPEQHARLRTNCDIAPQSYVFRNEAIVVDEFGSESVIGHSGKGLSLVSGRKKTTMKPRTKMTLM